MQKQWALPAIEKVRAGGDFDAAATLLDGQDRMAAIRSAGVEAARKKMKERM